MTLQQSWACRACFKHGDGGDESIGLLGGVQARTVRPRTQETNLAAFMHVGAVATRSLATITTKKTRHRSQPPTQHTRQPST
jgi:hypothetical protein